jgi:hypothetical protein
LYVIVYIKKKNPSKFKTKDYYECFVEETEIHIKKMFIQNVFFSCGRLLYIFFRNMNYFIKIRSPSILINTQYERSQNYLTFGLSTSTQETASIYVVYM